MNEDSQNPDAGKGIAKLVGYLNVASGADARYQSAVNSEGEAVAYKLGIRQSEFISIARAAAQEAMRKPSSAVRAYCREHLPALQKHRILAGDQWQVANWSLIAAKNFEEPTEDSPEANKRATCPSCGFSGLTIAELRREAAGPLRPVALICGGCRKNLSYDSYLRFNGIAT